MTAPTPEQLRALAWHMGEESAAFEEMNPQTWASRDSAGLAKQAAAALRAAADQLEAVRKLRRYSDPLFNQVVIALDLDEALGREHQPEPEPPFLYCGRVVRHGRHRYISGASYITFACPGTADTAPQEGRSINTICYSNGEVIRTDREADIW